MRKSPTSPFRSFSEPRSVEGELHMRPDDSPAEPLLPDKLLGIYKDICTTMNFVAYRSRPGLAQLLPSEQLLTEGS